MSSRSQKYQVHQRDVEAIFNWIKTDEIAIPEIQRPFVWKKSKVRNLMDSLYKGFPIGYLIVWRNPSVKLKDGKTSSGKRILIDGQQRVMALAAALLEEPVTNKDYKKEKTVIAFNPTSEEFEVQNPAILKDPSWIPNIAPIVNGKKGTIQVHREYCSANPDADEARIEQILEKLKKIQGKTLGLIELEHDLDIDEVTTIFERINSEGVPLSKSDFAMSKIASYGEFGSNLRNLIDYFCKLAADPGFYQIAENNKESDFKYLNVIRWLKDESDNMYEPEYSDVLRVALISEFNRGKMGDLVSLLSGRNFETREFEKEIQDNTFKRLEKAILRFANEQNFKKFIMIIRSAGFVHHKMIRAKGVLNFTYAAYLKLKDSGVPQGEIESFIRKWFVMSLLTNRYSSSPETAFDSDIKQLTKDHNKHLKYLEDSELSEAFWKTKLTGELETSSQNSQFLSVFFAAQIKSNDRGFLSTDITVRDMVEGHGDIHHIFPKAYVKRTYNDRKDYNQIANLAYMQSEINKSIGDSSPPEYLDKVLEQCKGGQPKFGGISNEESLHDNMVQNSIPATTPKASIGEYHDFLRERRNLMADKIRRYYESLP